MEWFSGVGLSLLQKSLDGLWTREQAISNNLANYETPNYKRQYVSFEEELIRQVEGNSGTGLQTARAIQNSEIYLGQSENETQREDGNSVDVTYENIEMARTQINYDYSSTVLNDYFSRLRTVINGK